MQKITLKKRRIIDIFNAIKGIGETKYSTFFLFALGRNKVSFEPVVEALNTAIKPEKEWLKYQTERLTLCKTMAVKDKDGKPLSEHGTYIFEDQMTFEDAIEKLKKKYKKAVDAYEKQQEEVEAFLEEKIEVEYYPIKASFLPKEINATLMLGIIELIEGEIPDPE